MERASTVTTLGESSSSGTRASPLAPGTAVGPYVVEGVLGEGGMGEVYAAYDPRLRRRVALKRVRGEADPHRSERLLEEARALAQLSHPNILTVFDVESHDGQLFLALELVRGSNLREWLAQVPRSNEEILRACAALGRGLAAAHDAGFVHGDIKPENLLIAEDGRPRIADFGLARSSSQVGAAQAGTPRYLSPEQRAGQPGDARSDQYSFCVALHEALTGEIPSPRRPMRSQMARRAARVLRRGLQPAAEARFPSLHALVRALEPAANGSRRVVMGMLASLTLCAAVGLGLHLLHRSRVDRCVGGFANVWDGPRRAAIENAFSSTKAPFAAHAWTEVEHRLNLYVSAWLGARLEACELQVTMQGPAAASRVQCLDRQRGDLRALTDLFSNADREVVEHAVDAAGALAPASACERHEPSRSDNSLWTRAEPSLSHANALLSAGKYQDALRATDAEVVRDVPDHALAAEVLLVRANAELALSRSTEAERDFHQALAESLASGRDRLSAQALLGLGSLSGERQTHFEEAARWQALAAATLEKLGEDDALKLQWLLSKSRSLTQAGRYQEGLAPAREALRYAQTEEQQAKAHLRVAQVLRRLRRYGEAAKEGELAIRLTEKVKGPAHPALASTLASQANVVAMLPGEHLARLREAIALAERALRIDEAALGTQHPQLATELQALGVLKSEANEKEAAVPLLERAVAVASNERTPAPVLAAVHVSCADVLLATRESARALEHYLTAAALYAKAPDYVHPNVASAWGGAGDVLLGLNRPAEAAQRFQQAVTFLEQHSGPQSNALAGPLTGLGRAQLAQRQSQRAVASLTRALAIEEQSGGSASILGETRFALARALAPSAPVRARALAEQSEQEYREAGPAHAEELKEVRAWLASVSPARSRAGSAR